MEELTGQLVMVNPALKNDPLIRQGQIGIITSADLAKDEVYVGFGSNALGFYSTDALLMLKRPNVIFADILTHVKELEPVDFKTLLEITILQEKNSVNYLRDAMQLAATNEKTLAYSMVTMQEALGVVLNESETQSQKANMKSSLDDNTMGEQVKGVIIEQTAYNDRVNKGMLPTIEIEGHTFYVDVRMDKLRPKDDFLSDGIVFSEIEDYFNDEKGTYMIPYNPKTKEFEPIDYENITEIPKHLIVIEIPSELKMDLIGWNRLNGFPLLDGIEEVGLQMSFEAKSATWEDIYVPEMIKENLEKIDKSGKENLLHEPFIDPQEEERKSGRRM